MTTQRARALRQRMTDAERRLWHHLRDRQLGGWKFRRQHPVGPFIVDFICLEKKVVIEVDAGAPLAEEHGPQVRPISELPGVRPLPGMGVHQVIENMSRYEL
ncbi:MAG: DUF559 domain-containing protein [Deltaproteobacteria bacterium]|nr:DUF559 domain-containing protein [Deltaproteobacteria bacterium]